MTGNLQVTQMRAIGFIGVVAQLHLQAFFDILVHHLHDETVDFVSRWLNVQRNNAAFCLIFFYNNLPATGNRRQTGSLNK